MSTMYARNSIVDPHAATPVTPTSNANHPQHTTGDDHSSQASATEPLSSSFSFDDLSRFPRELARKVDWITQCHNPLEYLQTLGFQSPQHHDTVVDMDDHVLDYPPDEHDEHDGFCDSETIGMPYVAFMVPEHCEYCGEASSKDCNPETCQRPASFFPTKRPPFCPSKAKSYNTNATKHHYKQPQQHYNTAKDDILTMDPWKVAPTPKTKNQWIAPTDIAAATGSTDESDITERENITAPRLLFPEMKATSGSCSELPSFSIDRRPDSAATTALPPQVWAMH